MKSKVVATEPEFHPYPKLMVGVDKRIDGMVVLFQKERIGTVIHASKTEYALGFITHLWNMDGFVDFDGNVCLSNK